MCEEGLLLDEEVMAFQPFHPNGNLRRKFDEIRAKFIGSGVPFQLNVPDFMMQHVIAVADERNALTLLAFDEAFAENRKALVADVFPAFRTWKQISDHVEKLREFLKVPARRLAPTEDVHSKSGAFSSSDEAELHLRAHNISD
jgi:hypothetical protein